MDGGIVCSECLVLLRANQHSEPIPPPKFGHRQVCVGCGKSILNIKSYNVPPHCPERDIILRWTPAHQISKLTRVCPPCWRAAKRTVQKESLPDVESSPDVEPSPDVESSPNVEPSPDVESSPDVEPSPDVESSPNVESPPQSQMEDFDCNQQEQPIVSQVPVKKKKKKKSRVPVPKIQSSVFKRAAACSSVCLFSGCKRPTRLMLPKLTREMLLIHNKFYVPTSARICRYHLNNGCWSDLTSNLQDFTGKQFDNIVSILARTASYQLDFENVSRMSANLCHYWLGMTADQFKELLSCVPSLSKSVKNPSSALCIYIVKLRTGESNERLSSLFHMSRRTLERKMDIARNCLEEDNVELTFSDP